MRWGLRRLLARRTFKNSRGTWPINESAGRRPENWPGWPANRQFAFVIMHDVEGPVGLEKCRQLLDLEEKLGFRSCFNFIPEGSYRVSSELRKEVVERGCEVGIHDLHHDGKLYNTRKGFSKKALRINEYLREWESVGFRSAFMLNNLDWLHELNVSYDASTFDTDPFEPQPQGQNTIFPFWVPKPRFADSQLERASPVVNTGYVELPYTLAQDSTLFLLLGESGPALWKQKLRWVAESGGMAMIGVHPDYVCFANSSGNAFTFPVRFYKEFLIWLNQEYSDLYWNATPREVANHFCQTMKAKGRDCISKLLILGSTISALLADMNVFCEEICNIVVM
jgi:peptidoglycan/xylan/chitin deacetylase (PgdA/CDA1 family)